MAVGKVTISSIAKLNGWLWDTHVSGFGSLWRGAQRNRR